MHTIAKTIAFLCGLAFVSCIKLDIGAAHYADSGGWYLLDGANLTRLWDGRTPMDTGDTPFAGSTVTSTFWSSFLKYILGS